MENLQQEQDKNTETQVTPSPTGQEGVKEENYVFIDGQKRPLKNYEAELKRKHEEDVANLTAEYDRKLVENKPIEPKTDDFWDEINNEAEQEIVSTGKTVPLKTIAKLASRIAQHNLEVNLTTKEKTEKEIRNFKKSVRSDPDWKDLEEDFDELAGRLKSNQINASTLEIILNSVRGKRLPDIVKKIREETKKSIEKDTQILGPTDLSRKGSPPKTSLSPEQKQELDTLNSENNLEWTEEEYKTTLAKKQGRFKNAGAKNTPQLLADVMIR